MVALLVGGYGFGQKISAEHQLRLLQVNLNEELPIANFDSLITPPTTLKFNHKQFLNDTIEKPISIIEKNNIYFDKKAIMVNNITGAYLFQIKKKYIQENEVGIFEHYYCTKGSSLYLISVVKSGVYIRKDKSYYSSFYYQEEL